MSYPPAACPECLAEKPQTRPAEGFGHIEQLTCCGYFVFNHTNYEGKLETPKYQYDPALWGDQ